MTDSSGNLSVDFLVGFTIFMVAFIWVATLKAAGAEDILEIPIAKIVP